MQKNLYFTMGKFAPLTLTTFMAVGMKNVYFFIYLIKFVFQIIKTSYSVFAVIKNTSD